MDSRVAILTVPSLIVLGLLVVHSFRMLSKARAAAFWIAVAAYGVARGLALQWVIERGLRATFPYAIRKPLFPVLGVPLQEIAGWAIVAYLGWWLGSRLSSRVFPQVAWACVFLAAISWAVESAAIAAGWWHWTVPVTQPVFLNVPSIAIVDWSFVGIDFLLPFVVLTAPALPGRWLRWLSLLAFPLHFVAHCFPDRISSQLPIPLHHLAHWGLVAALLWLALRSESIDIPFGEEPPRISHSWMPLAGLSIILVDAAAVELLLAREPRLLVALLPTLAVVSQTLLPQLGYAIAAVALLLALKWSALVVSAAPAAVAFFLTWGRRYRSWAPAAMLALVAGLALLVHAAGARNQDELMQRLNVALAVRDRGDLEKASRELALLRDEFPGSHVPPALLGQIEYRMEHLEDASRSFKRAVAIKQDFTEGFRYLAVIALRQGRMDDAGELARRGLAVDAADPSLSYLAARARGESDLGADVDRLDAAKTFELVSLAFEVGDVEGASTMLDRGIERWPEHRPFYPARVKLALQSGDQARAHDIVAEWLLRFPDDAEARRLSQQF